MAPPERGGRWHPARYSDGAPPAPAPQALRRRHFVKIAVLALGKIGLPLAVQFADRGHDVVGVDINPALVDLVNAGIEPFPGEAQLGEKLSRLVPERRLRATTDAADAVPGADVVVVVVPLFVEEK